MKKLIGLLAGLVFCISAAAQDTTVTASSITDSDGTLWANGTVSVQFVPNPSTPNPGSYRLCASGAALSPGILNQPPVNLGGSAGFSITTYDNSQVCPSGSQWQFTVCPNASSKCGIITTPVSGTTQDITTQVNAGIPAPRFIAVPTNFGYADIEAQLQLTPGGLYYNVTNACYRQFSGSSFSCVGNGGGLPTGCSSPSTGVIVCTNSFQIGSGTAVTIGPQNTVPTAWVFDLTTPSTALASLDGVSTVLTTPQTMAGPLNVIGLLNASAPGNFSSSGVSNCANVGFINGANLTSFNGATGPVQGAVCGALQTGTTEGNNVIEAPAVIGLADNFTNAPGGAGGSGGTDAVGGYFQGRIMQAGTPTVFPVAEGLNVAGIANAAWGNVTGEEIDMDVGSGATNASLLGLSISAPNITVAPRFSTAIQINTPAGVAATPWGTGITVQNGATAIGLELGTQNLTATSPSQTIVMVGENAGTVTASTIGQDSAGDILLTPNSSSQSVSITGGLIVSGSVAAVGDGNFANLSTGDLTANAIFASAGAAVHLIAGSGAGSSIIVTNGAQTINVLTIDNSGIASFTGTVNSTGYLVSGTAGVTSTTCTQWTGGICTHP
jgi:hypothetical protein